jgi:hypothetical protein
VVDAAGQGKPGLHVTVRNEDVQLAATTTNADGHFQVAGLRGGVVQVVAGESAAVCRLWAPNTAPPVARASALVVEGQTVRGQGPIVGMLCNPLVILGLVAIAVAVPLAIHHFREDRDSGS